MRTDRKILVNIIPVFVLYFIISCRGVSPPPSGNGNLSIAWQFPNNITCSEAQVVAIGVIVYNLDGSKEYENNFTCEKMSVTITNFVADTYTVEVIGYGTNGEIRYYGSSQVDINGNTTLIRLEYVLADIILSWAFESPANTDCVQAGVSKIGIKILNADGTVEFDESVKCSDKGGMITAFAPKKRYIIHLTGYDVAGTALYDQEVERTLNVGLNDIGTIVLKRIYTKAIFQVGWTFGTENMSCSAAGVQSVRIIFSAPSGSNVFLDKTIPCTPQQYMNQDLEEGVYSFVIYGIDSFGSITYSSTQKNVDLKNGYNDLGIVILNKRE
jgi:hypothetical protein